MALLVAGISLSGGCDRQKQAVSEAPAQSRESDNSDTLKGLLTNIACETHKHLYGEPYVGAEDWSKIDKNTFEGFCRLEHRERPILKILAKVYNPTWNQRNFIERNFVENHDIAENSSILGGGRFLTPKEEEDLKSGCQIYRDIICQSDSRDEDLAEAYRALAIFHYHQNFYSRIYPFTTTRLQETLQFAYKAAELGERDGMLILAHAEIVPDLVETPVAPTEF